MANNEYPVLDSLRQLVQIDQHEPVVAGETHLEWRRIADFFHAAMVLKHRMNPKEVEQLERMMQVAME